MLKTSTCYTNILNFERRDFASVGKGRDDLILIGDVDAGKEELAQCTMRIHKRKGILANWREVSKGKIRSKNIKKSDLPISGRPRPGLASLMHIEMSVLELVSQLIDAW